MRDGRGGGRVYAGECGGGGVRMGRDGIWFHHRLLR